MLRKILMAIVCVSMVAGLVGPDRSNAAAEEVEAVASVNGVKIYRQDFDREVMSAQKYFDSQGQDISMPEIKKAVLDKLVNEELMYVASQESGIKVNQAAVDAEYAGFRSRYENEDDFKKALDKLKIDEKGVKATIGKNLVVKQFVDQEFFEKTKVTEQDAKDYYENNSAAFQTPEKVRASHILISVKEDADEATKKNARQKLERIRKKIIAGGDFAVFAKNNSDCPSKANGGDLGFFTRGKMVKPFETAAFAMMPGDISEVVETQFGYHLIKVTEKENSGTVAFEEIKPQIETYLRQLKTQQSVSDYLKNLRSKAKIITSMPED